MADAWARTWPPTVGRCVLALLIHCGYNVVFCTRLESAEYMLAVGLRGGGDRRIPIGTGKEGARSRVALDLVGLFGVSHNLCDHSCSKGDGTRRTATLNSACGQQATSHGVGVMTYPPPYASTSPTSAPVSADAFFPPTHQRLPPSSNQKEGGGGGGGPTPTAHHGHKSRL